MIETPFNENIPLSGGYCLMLIMSLYIDTYLDFMLVSMFTTVKFDRLLIIFSVSSISPLLLFPCSTRWSKC